eukprot:jgi/Tetstr1/430867/TSEL_002009.t1
MAGGKKAADPTKTTPAETPAEPTETTRDTTTLQALALKVDALSTRLDEQDNNKRKEQRDIPSDDDEVGEALEDKRLEVGLAAAAKAQAYATFKRQAVERDTDSNKARKEKDKAARERRKQQRREADAKNRDKKAAGPATRHVTDGVARRADRCCPDSDYMRHSFLTAELRRFTAAGAWEKSSCAWWVSRAFFVPKPGDNQWRFIIDLRVLNTFCARKRLRMETLMGVRHLTAKGDYMFPFDLQDGFYALGIAPSDRDYFTVNIRGTLYRLCGLPMGWSLSPYYFTTFTMTRSLGGLNTFSWQSRPRFYLRELHDVVGSKWGGRVRMTHQLRRDLQWWTAVPTRANGRPIHRHVETAYMHCDSSGYGWGAVPNGRLEARGFWEAADERQHITWKELKAVRLAVESFPPHLAGRRVLLHEDNQAVCSVLAGLASRFPAMMAELRKRWYLLDSNGVHIRARYIRSAANVWADRLSRHLDSDDWKLDPVLFAELEAMWGAHSVDRFASALNAMLPRYNAAWLDPGCEAVDSLHLSDAEWRRENNYCNPPWPLLPDLGVPPLGGTAATVARYIAWQGLRGTVKAASLQPYLSAINGFYRDHGAEPVAQGDLISKVRKGLAASQVEPDPPGVRTDVPARLITRTLRLAETLREELGPTWTRDQLPRILLFRAAMARLNVCYC